MSFLLFLCMDDFGRERIGCVKSERWASVASEQISKLGTFCFDPQKAEGKDSNDCDVKCLVCQFQYEANESLRMLPCKHTFHEKCIEQWLLEYGRNCPVDNLPIDE